MGTGHALDYCIWPKVSFCLCQNGRIAPDEELDETQGLSAAEIEERDRTREARAQATILEIVGDLPDADMAPPENVLFVCKLNPVTSDDDLEIIFSRFGKVKRLVSDGMTVFRMPVARSALGMLCVLNLSADQCHQVASLFALLIRC
jgi:RNA recognition motif-containing protein